MRLIDADNIENIIVVHNKFGGFKRIDAPTIDAEPVKHGKWEEISEYNGWGDTHYRCSACGEEWNLESGTPAENNMNFCSNCGAKMDGGENNGT